MPTTSDNDRNDRSAQAEGLDQLLEAAAAICCRMLAKSMLSPEDRKDTISETLLKFTLFAKMRLDLTIKPFPPHLWQPWLVSVLKKQEAQRFRVLRRERGVFKAAPAGLELEEWLGARPAPSENRSAAEDLEAVKAAHRKLAPHLKHTVKLVAKGVPIEQIAVEMNVSQKTVRLYLRTARAILGTALE
jgi:RNA polymerase sigma factor (sigma-70 family)